MIEKKKIILSGGGTGGSVSPLLASAREIFKINKDVEFFFLGTKEGPELIMVQEVIDVLPVSFSVMISGKLRRYFSWQNFKDLFNIGAAFLQSLYLIKKIRPDLIISAGSFVSVPLVWAAAVFKIPVLIHQQDLRAGLANRLMAPLAKVVTVSFQQSLAIYGDKAKLIGNPVFLPKLDDRKEILAELGFELDKPVILIFGGGTGAIAINEAVKKCLPELLKITQVIHLSGKGKINGESMLGYFVSDFVGHEKLINLMAVANLVIARPGLATITELSALAKASILIPMPDTHQEDNALLCAQKKAAYYLKQENLSSLPELVLELLNDKEKTANLSLNMKNILAKDASKKMAEICWEIIK